MDFDYERVHFKDSDELNRYMVDCNGDTAVLACSLGKDSIATWIQMRRYFKRVIPIHRYIVPGLRFVAETAAYYEDKFQTKIHMVPNPIFYSLLWRKTWQPAWRRDPVKDLVMTWEYSNAEEGSKWARQDICAREGVPSTIYAGVGQRASDSLTRRMTIQKHGVIKHVEGSFYPIFDWKFADMKQAFRDEHVKLAVDYRLWNRSFDSCRARFMPALRRYYPDDYERVKFWFPLIDADEARRTFFHRNQEAKAHGVPAP